MFDHRPINRPYPGLRPFEPHEATIFFGREGHTDRLLEILQRERFLAVVGPSGGGKSSLVRAGLLPALAGGRLGTGSHWRLAMLRPGSQPVLALAQALSDRHALGDELSVQGTELTLGSTPVPLIAATSEQVTPDAALIAAELRRDAGGFDRVLAQAQARREGLLRSASIAAFDTSPPRSLPTLNLLVLVDQFEELFTYRDAAIDPAESVCFVEMILRACRLADRPRVEPAPGSIRVVVALTMRTDYLGHCVEFGELPEAINRAQYLTPRLKRDELRAAIIGPARIFEGDVDAGFVESTLDDVGNKSDQLPLLQHALAQWWSDAVSVNAQKPFVNATTTKDAGTFREALNLHADRLYARMSPLEQRGCEALFRAITAGREGADAVRRPQRLSDVATWSGVPEATLLNVVHTLASPDVSFLHYGHKLDRDSMVDLTHEALMRQWDQLKGWVASELRRGQDWGRWNARAAEHAVNKESLLTGIELTRALDWWNPGAEMEDGLTAWAPSLAWALRYAGESGGTQSLTEVFGQLRQYLIDSRDAARRAQEAAKARMHDNAEAAAALTQTMMAKRRATLYAALSVAALALAGVAASSWHEADRLKTLAEQATLESRKKAKDAERSASAAHAARAAALEAMRRRDYEVLAAVKAQNEAEVKAKALQRRLERALAEAHAAASRPLPGPTSATTPGAP